MVVHIIPLGFHSKQIYQAIKKHGAEKIYFVVSEGKDSISKEKISDTINQAEKIAKEILNVKYKIIKIESDYNLEKRFKLFNEFFKEEKEIVVNLTGGPKIDSLILYAVALQNYQKVKEVIYIREDINDMIELPKFISTDCLTSFELELIRELKKGECTSNDLSKKLAKPMPQIIRYLKNLENKGFIITTKTNGKRKAKLRFSIFV